MERKRIGSLLLTFALVTIATASSPLIFYNKGGMNVGSSGTVYIAGGIHHSGSDVLVVQNGQTILTGDFMDDVPGHVFSTNYQGTVTGMMEFRGNSEQTVTSNLTPYSPGAGGVNTGKMDKTAMYVKFPDFKINNGSRVVVTPGMGVSVNTLVFANGNLRLQSDLEGNLDQDASLLVYKPVSSYAGGYMEIERNVVYNQGTLVGNSSNMKFFGFSAPLKNMYLDYFTDHWIFDPRTNAYNTLRQAQFSPGLGYYVVIREISNADDPNDYIQDGMLINNEHFLFNRSYYPDFSSGHWWNDIPASDKPQPQEELNTGDVSPAGGLVVGDNYFGNPYTCALDINSLFTVWGSSIESKVWLWAGQAGNFLTVTPDMSTIDGNQKVIPSQQMFVVEGKTGDAGFSIPASARVHNAHRFLRSEETNRNELLVEIRDSQLDNYARLAIGLRTWGRETGDDESDARYVKSTDPGVPQMYATAPSSVPGSRDTLSINSLPVDTKYTDFEFIPAQIEGERNYALRVTRQESLQTETAILIDKQTGAETNLFETDRYEFSAEKDDAPGRFRIVFAEPQGAGERAAAARNIYCSKGILYVTGNRESDINAPVEVYSISGVPVFRDRITQTGVNSYALSLPEGVYIVRTGELREKIMKSEK